MTHASPASWPWVALLATAVCAALAVGGEPLAQHLAFVHDGNLLTALSAQWVHWRGSHALGNAAVLLVCGSYLERRLGHARLALVTLLALLLVAVYLLGSMRQLAQYRGASGLASCWLTLALLHLARVRAAWAYCGLALSIGLAFCVPAWLGSGSGVLPPGVQPVWPLHGLLATAAGAMAACGLAARRMNHRKTDVVQQAPLRQRGTPT